MRSILPKNLLQLANACPAPLYVVGGSVRDFLANLTPINSKRDFDVCAPLSADEFVEIAKNNGFSIRAVYKNTGTVKFQDQAENDYEYSAFRSDKYVRGIHAPVEISFTTDITLDACRRDFTCNAVYYDIKQGEYVDPLQGIPAIQEKRLTTVASAKKVFGEDGLRLMRLARQSAQLGFTPDNDCLQGATENSALIKDITPERIFTELCAILFADKKYGIANGHYHGVKLLEQTGVLAHILPELTLGKNLLQRPDFHKYDVLEHSLRALLYADERVRFSALLHDVGKPFCMQRDNHVHEHPEEGERLTREILTRLKAPKKLVDHTTLLVKWHMYDFNCQTKETKLRRFFVEHYELLQDLFLLKQADFSACTDDLSVAPTCQRWNTLLEKMREENTPFTRKSLAVSGKDLLSLGIPAPAVSQTLNRLLLHVAVHPKENTKERLSKLAFTLK